MIQNKLGNVHMAQKFWGVCSFLFTYLQNHKTSGKDVLDIIYSYGFHFYLKLLLETFPQPINTVTLEMLSDRHVEYL